MLWKRSNTARAAAARERRSFAGKPSMKSTATLMASFAGRRCSSATSSRASTSQASRSLLRSPRWNSAFRLSAKISASGESPSIGSAMTGAAARGAGSRLLCSAFAIMSAAICCFVDVGLTGTPRSRARAISSGFFIRISELIVSTGAAVTSCPSMRCPAPGRPWPARSAVGAAF